MGFEKKKLLDPEDVLNDAEEKELDDIMKKIAKIVKNKHIMMKPMF